MDWEHSQCVCACVRACVRVRVCVCACVCVFPLTAGDLSLVRAVRTLWLSIAAPAARDTLTIQTRKLSWGTRLPSWREGERERGRERGINLLESTFCAGKRVQS